MIRKILFFICLIYTIVWFTIAYTIKSNIVNAIKNSETDNIKLSYSQVEFSGFPGRFQIHLVEPKIKLIHYPNYKEIFTDNITFLFDFSFKTAKIILGKEIIEQENVRGKLVEYVIQSKEAVTARVKFKKPIYKLSDKQGLKSAVRFLQVDNKLLSVVQKGEEIFNIADLMLSINTTKIQDSENIALQLRLLYSASENFLNFKTAQLDLATTTRFTFDKSKDNNFIHDMSIGIQNLSITCDNTSKMNLQGDVQLRDSLPPNGKLSFELIEYNNLIDKLIPKNWLLHKKIATTIVNEIAISSTINLVNNNNEKSIAENIKFDVELSDNGVYVGSINLLELRIQDTKLETSLED